MPYSPKNPADPTEFARRLVALLAAHNIQRRGAGAYLAKKYQVSSVTANAWLNGVHRPDIPTARQIAQDHGTTFDELYWGDNPETESMVRDNDPPTYELRPDQRAILELWEALGDKDRRTLQAVGDALAKPHPSGNAGGGSSTS